MILQIVTDTRKINNDRNLLAFQEFRVTNSRKLEHLRRLNGTSRENDFTSRHDSVTVAITRLLILNAGSLHVLRVRSVKHNLRYKESCQNMQVRTANIRINVTTARETTRPVRGVQSKASNVRTCVVASVRVIVFMRSNLVARLNKSADNRVRNGWPRNIHGTISAV